MYVKTNVPALGETYIQLSSNAKHTWDQIKRDYEHVYIYLDAGELLAKTALSTVSRRRGLFLRSRPHHHHRDGIANATQAKKVKLSRNPLQTLKCKQNHADLQVKATAKATPKATLKATATAKTPANARPAPPSGQTAGATGVKRFRLEDSDDSEVSDGDADDDGRRGDPQRRAPLIGADDDEDNGRSADRAASASAARSSSDDDDEDVNENGGGGGGNSGAHSRLGSGPEGVRYEALLNENQGDATEAMGHPSFEKKKGGKSVPEKLGDLRSALGHFPDETPKHAAPNPRIWYCGFCQKWFLLATLGDVKAVKKHMKDSHNPALLGVLDGSVAFEDMEDAADHDAPRLTAQKCRETYQAAPTPEVAIDGGIVPKKYQHCVSCPESYVE